MALVEARSSADSFGNALRFWRKSRGLTQLELANRAATTTRYMSFLETGRSRPGSDMVRRLAEALDLPRAEVADFFLAAGYTIEAPTTSLAVTLQAPFRRAIHYSVAAHEPYPSFAINRWYDVIEKNTAAEAMFSGDKPKNNVNIIEQIYDNAEMKTRMANWKTVAVAMAARLRREAAGVPGDRRMQSLLELAQDTIADFCLTPIDEDSGSILVCPIFRDGDLEVRTISMIARFGVTRELLDDEIRVETIFPYDQAAEDYFKALSNGAARPVPCG